VISKIRNFWSQVVVITWPFRKRPHHTLFTGEGNHCTLTIHWIKIFTYCFLLTTDVCVRVGGSDRCHYPAVRKNLSRGTNSHILINLTNFGFCAHESSPVLLYATEAGPFSSRDKCSISFAMTRVLLKNFNTRSQDIIEQCQLSLCLACCQLQIKYSWEK